MDLGGKRSSERVKPRFLPASSPYRVNAKNDRGIPCRSSSVSSSAGSDETDEDQFDEFDEFDELFERVISDTPFRADRTDSNHDNASSSPQSSSVQPIQETTVNNKGKEVGTATEELVNVLESQYTGNAFRCGNHSVQLTAVHSPKGGTQQSLFRWLHVQQRNPSLDELSTNIHGILHLSTDELSAFDMLLGVARDRIKVRQTVGGHRMEQIDSLPLSVEIEARSSRRRRLLKWFCIPYLTLQKDTDLMTAIMTDSFSARDGPALEGKSLHIAQIWCIMLESSLLVTCGPMSYTDLRGQALKVVTKPPIEPASIEAIIYVSYESVLWAFPLRSCPTWFSFAKRFNKFWPSSPISFYYLGGGQDTLVTKEEWPWIVSEARHSNRRVILELRTSSHSKPFAAGILQPLPNGNNVEEVSQAAGSSITNGPKHVNDEFRVFSWVETPHSDVTEQLELIEKFIRENTATVDSTAYEACYQSSCAKIHAYLEGIRKETGPLTPENEESSYYMVCVDLYNAALMVFLFFLPYDVNIEAPTVPIFWGAVKALVEMPWNSKSTVPNENETPGQKLTDAEQKKMLWSIARVIQAFHVIFCDISDNDRCKIFTPKRLVMAWPHLVLALAQSSQEGDVWQNHIDRAETLIKRGISELMDNLETEDLLRTEVIRPMELLSLIMQDRMAGRKWNLPETYRSSMKTLADHIINNPQRSYQRDINKLKDEILLVLSVLQDQEYFVESAEDHRYTQITKRELLQNKREEEHRSEQRRAGFITWKISSTDPKGVSGLIRADCRRLLEQQHDKFRQLYGECERLEAINITDVEIIKDKQEKAIYVFTVVTLIFLPLSTISGIFGMNTSDVRNMALGQWAYWATALPATLAVILGGLWWLGELRLPNFWSQHRRGNIPSQTGYFDWVPPRGRIAPIPYVHPLEAYAQISPPAPPQAYPQISRPPTSYAQNWPAPQAHPQMSRPPKSHAQNWPPPQANAVYNHTARKVER